MSTPEIIYLIPGEDIEGYPGMVWCESSAPSDHCDPEEAVKYVRADKYDYLAESEQRMISQMAGENERLQARVAELESFINQAPVETGVCMCGEEMYRHSSQPNHTPMNSWDYERDLILRNEASKTGGTDNAG